MEAMIRKQRKRMSENNKRSAFRVRKRPVPQEKINRYVKEHGVERITADNKGNVQVNIDSAGMAIITSTLVERNNLTRK
jgi:hypothetical protein